MASSSVCRKRLDPLCCFLLCWLFRGVGEARDEAPVPLPRCCAKTLVVLMDGVWFWAGEAGPEDAEILEDEATDGGLVDMTPNQGFTAARR
jgi:hypothetical protein